MKHKSIFAVVLVAALAICALAGCSSQTPAPSNTSNTSPSAEQTQDQILSELKDLVANPVEYKSVTITEETASITKSDTESEDKSAESADAKANENAAKSDESATKDESKESISTNEEKSENAARSDDGKTNMSEVASTAASAATNAAVSVVEKTLDNIFDSDAITSKTVYKFDESGNQIKTSAEIDAAGVKMTYISDGDKAVCITDGPIYGGTIEQFNLPQFKGAKAYLESTIGDLSKLVDCADTVEKIEPEATDELVYYSLTLDPEKYTASDDTLKLMADSGTKVESTAVTIGFDKDGYIVSVDKVVEYSTGIKAVWNLTFDDFDKTTVQDMPEANATYEQMDSDILKKIGEFFTADNETEAPAEDNAK